jgi:integrase
MKIGGYNMAKNKYHHLYKRDGIYYFRKATTRISLETRIGTEAVRFRDRLLENYRLHGHFTVADESKGQTFGQVSKMWAKIHSNKVKYSTWRDYRSVMNTHVLPAFKDCFIEKITYLDVENFIENLQCGSKRINNILVPMRSIFKMAFKQGYIKENVMLKVDNLPIDQPDIFPFTHVEVMQILEVIDSFYKPYTAVRFYTGMRAGEIDGLEWSDYKEEMAPNTKLHINKAFVYGQEGKTKTKKSKRYIDCIPLVTEALDEQKKMTGKGKYIFLTKDGSRMNPDHFRDVVWKPALKRAGLEYRPPIQTRHTFATMTLTEGEDIGWVQKMLGHSSLQMIFTRYYAWIPRKTRRDGSAFMDAITNKSGQDDSKTSNTGGKVIPLFGGSVTKTTHQRKKDLHRNDVSP